MANTFREQAEERLLKSSAFMRKAETLLTKDLEIGSKTRDGGLSKGRHVGFTLVPPVGEAALRVDVDQADRASSRELGLHRKMSGQGRLTRPALLRCHCQDAHAVPLPIDVQFSVGVTPEPLKSG